MKRFLLALLLLLSIASAAHADALAWRKDSQTGWWAYFNEAGIPVGWYYKKVRDDNCNYCYPTYHWEAVQRVSPYGSLGIGYGDGTYNSTANVSIKYSKTWKEDGINALSRAKAIQAQAQADIADSSQFLSFVKESGLQLDPTGLPNYGAMGMGAYGGSPYGAALAASGVSILTQGLYGQGSTVYGNAAYYGPQPVDWQKYQDNAKDYQDRSISAAAASNSAVGANLSNANAVSADIQKFGMAVTGVLQAAQATVTPKSETHTWQSGPAAVQQYAPQAQPQLNQGGALSITRGQVVINRTCAQCHSGNNQKATPFLSQLATMSDDERCLLANSALGRMRTNDPAKKMPPPDVHAFLDDADAIGVYDVIRTGSL